MIDRRRQPSLRLRLQTLLIVPLVLLLLTAAAVTYALVLRFDNREHDQALAADAISVATLLARDGFLSDQANYLLRYDSEGSNYFVLQSNRRGLLDHTGQYVTAPANPHRDTTPRFFDALVDKVPVRAVTLSVPSQHDPGELFTVTLAESLDSRVRLADEMLLITLALHGLLMATLIGLTGLGVRFGLRSLQPLIERLTARSRLLEPVTDELVPREILPLTRTIDSSFARLRAAIAAQDNFVADAAHQLRTPLAGLRLHAEQSLVTSDPQQLKDSLQHIHRLTLRASRTANQLLALLRAQSPLENTEQLGPVDLAAVVREVIAEWAPVGLRQGIDFGCQGTDEAMWINGSAPALQELLDNLLDNCQTYGGSGTQVTVTLERQSDGRIRLAVSDDGPGVPANALPKLGTRFFRVPGSASGGTGLGLAIVARIAERHWAALRFSSSTEGGLCVALLFASLSPPG